MPCCKMITRCDVSAQVDTIKSTIADQKVVVYSKTYCPYCDTVSHETTASIGGVWIMNSLLRFMLATCLFVGYMDCWWQGHRVQLLLQ